MIYQLIYSSRVVPGIHASDLMEIADSARTENVEQGITGILLASEDQIVQILEGSKEQVEQLFAHIQKDLRHIEITVLATGENQVREFEGQAMVLKFVQKASCRKAFEALIFKNSQRQDIAA